MPAGSSLLWPGNSGWSGSRKVAALFTAVAASPKPTAISRTLPGYSVMSPAAYTRGTEVRIAVSTMILRSSIVDAPLLERADVGGEAERGDDRLRLVRRHRAVLVLDVHRVQPLVSPSSGVDLGVGDDRRVEPFSMSATLAACARKCFAAVHERDRGGEAVEGERPVDGAVAAADDDDVLAGVGARAP